MLPTTQLISVLLFVPAVLSAPVIMHDIGKRGMEQENVKNDVQGALDGLEGLAEIPFKLALPPPLFQVVNGAADLVLVPAKKIVAEAAGLTIGTALDVVEGAENTVINGAGQIAGNVLKNGKN
jgi:hypothetical protein